MNMRKVLPRGIMAGIWLLLWVTGSVSAQRYVPTDDGSTIQFRVVNHLFVNSTVNGYFKGLKGSIFFDPKDLKTAAMDVTVAVSTISTGIGLRDKDLKKENYFNMPKFPVIRMRSLSVAGSNKPGTYILNAALIIKGVTKNISFPFTATVSDKGCLFKGSFNIDRTGFGVGDTKKIDNQVTVLLQVFAKKQ
jgi:polyisoprenoid-binding protein YceI